MLKNDLLRYYNMTSGNKIMKIINCYRMPGVHAVVCLRFGQWLRKKNIVIRIFLEPIYMLFYHKIRFKFGIEIPRGVTVGEGFYIGHHGGIVINSNAVIGKRVNISQQVVIGVSGEGEKKGCPVIGNNVYISPGARIFGKIKIGNNVKIGANAIVYKDIPDDSIVILSPGFSIIPRKKDEKEI